MGLGYPGSERSLKTSPVAPTGALKAQRPVLLPFEKQLAATIGVTEDEYILFKKEVERKSRVRPAAYAHIPDIRNEPTTTAILVNLAIGLVLTGVSVLLAPKPKAPNQQKEREETPRGPNPL